MLRHYPNSISDKGDGSYSADDVRRGLIALHTDYECPFCKKLQSVAAMGGYGSPCIRCGKKVAEAAEAPGDGG